MAQEAMVYLDITLTAYDYVWMFCALIGKEIERKDDGSIRRVFEWNHTVGSLSGLHLAEDVFNCRLW
jgi:hypothetical protein